MNKNEVKPKDIYCKIVIGDGMPENSLRMPTQIYVWVKFDKLTQIFNTNK